MKSKFLIVADLGLVKAYKLDFEEAHSRLLDKWSRTATPERMPFPRLTSARCKRNWSVKGAATCACWPILTTSASEPRGKSSADAAAQKEAFIRELLPVIDNLERALGSDVSTSPEQLRQGVQMTLQQLTQLLRHHGIEADESLGRPFDPHYHEAVSVRHDPSQPDHIILETFQRGYRRGNEVFRPAKVVVDDLSHAETGRRAD